MDLGPIGQWKVAKRYLQGGACDCVVLLSGFSSLSMKTPKERDGSNGIRGDWTLVP
jgi:hypothetical protein